MDEQQSGRFEPGGDFVKEVWVGFHMFEHFDREDVGESWR